MQSITIVECFELTDRALSAIGQSRRGLTSIDMIDNCSITDRGIACLTKECRELTHIDMSSDYNIRNNSTMRKDALFYEQLFFVGFVNLLMSH